MFPSSSFSTAPLIGSYSASGKCQTCPVRSSLNHTPLTVFPRSFRLRLVDILLSSSILTRPEGEC